MRDETRDEKERSEWRQTRNYETRQRRESAEAHRLLAIVRDVVFTN